MEIFKIDEQKWQENNMEQEYVDLTKQTGRLNRNTGINGRINANTENQKDQDDDKNNDNDNNNNNNNNNYNN